MILDNAKRGYDSRIANVSHPHWYKPPSSNTNIPIVAEKVAAEAMYSVTRNLNTVIQQREDEATLVRTPPVLPDWVKRYSPPKVNKDGNIFQMSRSQLAETLLVLNGNKFRFNRWNEHGEWEDRRYLLPIYNLRHNRVFFMCGRQVEKTQTLGNMMTLSCVASPYYKALYVSPSIIQTSTFSSDKLSPLINDSPLISNYFVNNNCRRMVFDKSFANGAYMFMRSAFYNADRARGISAYLFAADEIQDQLSENLEVISECLAHAPFPRWIYACTPKTLDNTAAAYWEKSRQGEWFVPCMAHGTPRNKHSWLWQPLGIKNIGKKGLICVKCGKALDSRLGEWRWMGDPKAEWAGFHISQLMVPWVPWEPAPDRPLSIIAKMDDYGEARFYNEVLGLPFDDSEKPITRKDLHRCCNPDLRNMKENLLIHRNRGMLIFGGGDWGTKTIKSYSLYVAIVFDGMKWHVIYAKRYEGAQADYSYIIPDLQDILLNHGIHLSGFDQGIGFAQNDLLAYHVHGTMDIPYDQRKIFPILYMGAQSDVIKWKDEQECFHLHRTRSLNRLFQMIKREEIVFPCWDDMHKPFFEDILHIHKEIRTSEKGERVMYSKHPDLTDDFAHALNFALQIGMTNYGMI